MRLRTSAYLFSGIALVAAVLTIAPGQPDAHQPAQVLIDEIVPAYDTEIPDRYDVSALFTLRG